MNRRRSRFAPALAAVLEPLESRIVLSGEVAAQIAHVAATKTTLAASAGTLAQPITFTVTVRAAAAAGAPQGTVNITDHGTVLQSVTLSPTTSTNARYAYSQATWTMTPQPGGGAYFFGRHAVSATFIPSGTFLKSIGKTVFTVPDPTSTSNSDGVTVATVTAGSGPQIQSGQTANVLYTGYLEKTGQVFDDSINDGGAPLQFTLGSGQVIPGFEAGTEGMQVGETRLILIPPSEGYGDVANGPIPKNSTLIFVVTLESIS